MINKKALSLKEAISGLQSGTLTPLDYINRLEDGFADIEANIQAFVPEEKRFDRLRREAEALMEKYPDPEMRPALFGIPVGVKDIFHVKGFITRAGSKLPAHILQAPEAPVVTMLKYAGALIMGKTVTAEFAYIAPGRTKNPHNYNHTPGGSSSGSAAAVASGLCPLALGTQTIGSVTRPAAYCGIVGYKPSFDRIDKFNVIPVSVSLDHVGLFTRTVDDLDLAARLICVKWQAFSENPNKPVLGIPEGIYLDYVEAEGRDHFQKVIERLGTHGYTIKNIPCMADFKDIHERHLLLMSGEMANVHKQWYEDYEDLYRPETKAMIEQGKKYSAERIMAAARTRLQLRQEIMDLMTANGIDMWLAPAATGTAPEGLESTGNSIMSLPWAQCGLPVINIPTGLDDRGLSFGTQFVGRWFCDEEMIGWLKDIEKVFG